jgi:hypothetical protein
MRVKRATLLPFALYTLFGFTVMLLEVPNVRLFERAICVRHYKDTDVDEAACKKAAIQNTLSNIVGWKFSFDACAGMEYPDAFMCNFQVTKTV